MTNNVISYVIIGVLISAVIFFALKPAKVETVQLPGRVDTVYKEITVTDVQTKPVYVYKTVPGPKVNTDSLQGVLWGEAYNFWAKLFEMEKEAPAEFIAVKDTIYKQEGLKLNVSYNSPLMLHPSGYFNIQAEFKQRTVTETIYKDKPASVWDYIGLGAYGGYGSNNIQNKFSWQIGAGIIIKFF